MLLDKSYSRIKEILLENMCISEGSRVLDIGCGLKANFYNIPSYSYIGIDRDEGVINYLKKGLTGTFHTMDARNLKFKNEYFDYIISLSFFHHLSKGEIKDVFAGVKRLIKKTGRLIIADGVYPDSKLNIAGQLIRFFDRGRYVRDRHSFKKIFSSDFYIEKEYYFVDKIFAYCVLVMSYTKENWERANA